VRIEYQYLSVEYLEMTISRKFNDLTEWCVYSDSLVSRTLDTVGSVGKNKNMDSQTSQSYNKITL